MNLDITRIDPRRAAHIRAAAVTINGARQAADAASRACKSDYNAAYRQLEEAKRPVLAYVNAGPGSEIIKGANARRDRAIAEAQALVTQLSEQQPHLNAAAAEAEVRARLFNKLHDECRRYAKTKGVSL